MAAFDFDGTLVPGDSFLPFLRLACGSLPTVGALSAAVGGSLRRSGRVDRDAVKVATLLRCATWRHVSGGG
ncbi:MAG: hypothetical protein ACRDY2_02590 [Acidimicrobiales bacterium]